MTLTATKPIPTRQGNPCKICGDTSGDCREVGELALCQKSPNGGTESSEFRFIRPSKCGVWGIYAPGQETRTRAEIDHYRRQQLERLAKEAEHYRNGLTVEQRDKNIRAIAAYIGLDAHHKELLRQRGLPDEHIKGGLFFSVADGSQVLKTISDKMPGVRLRGSKKYLTSSTKGIACVAFDHHNRAIGFQIRDERPDCDNKYRWAKSTFSSHLQNGELPLTTLRINQRSKAVFLTEGLLKPFIVSSRFKLNTIGAAGGQFLASKTQFAAYLSGYTDIVCCPDAGDTINPHTLKRWLAIADAMGGNFKLWFAWWNQHQKDSLDIDELQDFSQVKYLSRREWEKKITS